MDYFLVGGSTDITWQPKLFVQKKSISFHAFLIVTSLIHIYFIIGLLHNEQPSSMYYQECKAFLESVEIFIFTHKVHFC